MRGIAPLPSPFPDDPSLGLPSWCPAAPTLWDSNDLYGHSPKELALRAGTLTAAGRLRMLDLSERFRPEVLGWSGASVNPMEIRRLELYIRAHGRIPRDYPVEPTATIAQRLSHCTQLNLQDALLGIGASGVERANTRIVNWLRRGPSTTPRGRDVSQISATLVRASLAWQLPWTTEPPAAWWWPQLHSLMWTRALQAVLILPPAFLPSHVIDQVPQLAASNGMHSALPYLYSSSVTPTFMQRLCEYEGIHDDIVAYEVGRYLAAHRDPIACLGDYLPRLVGHRNPTLAAVGLQIIARQQGQHLGRGV